MAVPGNAATWNNLGFICLLLDQYLRAHRQLTGWEDRPEVSSWPSSMNPHPQSIIAVQSLGAAISAQQVKIHLAASWSTEGYPLALSWCQGEGSWPLGTLLGIPTWYFCCYLLHPLDARPGRLYWVDSAAVHWDSETPPSSIPDRQ